MSISEAMLFTDVFLIVFGHQERSLAQRSVRYQSLAKLAVLAENVENIATPVTGEQVVCWLLASQLLYTQFKHP